MESSTSSFFMLYFKNPDFFTCSSYSHDYSSLSAATQIWSFQFLIYQVSSGKPPFAGGDFAASGNFEPFAVVAIGTVDPCYPLEFHSIPELTEYRFKNQCIKKIIEK